MNLKTASFLALIGTILSTVLLVYDFISGILHVLQGLVPLASVLSTGIYAFASLTLAVFFFVFHRGS
jgi:hypothetical protein